MEHYIAKMPQESRQQRLEFPFVSKLCVSAEGGVKKRHQITRPIPWRGSASLFTTKEDAEHEAGIKVYYSVENQFERFRGFWN